MAVMTVGGSMASRVAAMTGVAIVPLPARQRSQETR